MARSIALVGTILVASVVACAAGKKHEFDDDAAVVDDAPPPLVEDASSACDASAVVCSRDLHSVIDVCSGTVVQSCPSDMGCAEGRCVPACESAEKSQGTVGCAFWTTPATGDVFPGQAGGCFAASIANTWNAAVHIEAEYDGQALDISKSTFLPRVNGHQVDYEPLEGPLPPSEVAIVFLSQDPLLPPGAIKCPRPAAVAANPLPTGTGRAHAFHLTTDLPVSAYSVFPYGGAASAISAATNLLPIASWGTNYLMIDGWESRTVDVANSQSAIQIVASADDTEVRIGAEVAGGEPTGDGGVGQTSLTLARGEVYQILQRRDFAGKAIESNKPIAVFGGADCFDVPSSIEYCDSAQQQIPPISAWGSEYAAVRFRNRTDLVHGEGAAVDEESVPWRIVGAADGTTLSYAPERPSDAPTKLAAGEATIFWSNKRFVVKSQDHDHPFYLAAYMTGADSDGAQAIGDPDFVNVVPANQYLDAYVFFADVTYEYTTLTVVRRNEGKGFQEVNLDCAGVLTNWKNLDGPHPNAASDGTATFEWTYVDLVRHWDPQPYAGGGTCGSGRHEIRSDGPFTVTVWGLAPYDSYAYPVGAGIRNLTNVRVTVK